MAAFSVKARSAREMALREALIVRKIDEVSASASLLAPDPARLLVWSGAGISLELPTGAPLAASLTDRVLRYAFLPETGALLQCYYAELRLSRERPRLETLLDVVSAVHSDAAVADLLSDLVDAPPNQIHRLLADLSSRGAQQITANFDDCLERAGCGDVLHFHGSLAGDPTTATLGATLRRIERGFPRDLGDQLRRRLDSCAAIVFIGYSGSDFFDVDPFLGALPAGVMAGKSVLWISHQDCAVTLETADDAARRIKQLKWLQEAGASVTLVSGRTREVLADLCTDWRLPGPAAPSGSLRAWAPERSPSPETKALATLELYSLMGLRREVERMLDLVPSLDPRRRLSLLGDVRWFQGRYREAAAARLAAGLQPRPSRQATDFWIRGQYVRALHAALRAVTDADRTIGTAHEVPLEERLVRAETLARIWQHMRRTPDARLLATQRLKRFALEHLPDPDDLARQGTPLGTHHSVRVRDARAALAESSSRAPSGVESFGEYEALGGWMNYRHGQLRADAARGRVPAERYRLLMRDHITLGGPGDAARVVFIPGAHRVFSRREVISALKTLDVTTWHRLRLALLYWLARLTDR